MFTKDQIKLMILVLSEERESVQDYINDGTFDDDEDEKERAQEKCHELTTILDDLGEML